MTAAMMPIGVQATMLPELDFPDQLALCQRLGVTHYTLRPRIIDPAQRDKPFSNWGNHRFDLTPQRLLDEGPGLRKMMADAGITPFGTVPSTSANDSDDNLLLHICGAAAVGAGRVRINPPSYPNTPFDYAALLDATIKRYEAVIKLAKPAGIKVVMETHAGSFVAGASLAWNICRHFDPADLGVIFDLPNFAREGNNRPVLAVATIGRWIDHVHLGGACRVTVGYDALGCRRVAEQFCPWPQSDIHVPSWLTALHEAGIRVPLMIEEFAEPQPGAQRLEDAVCSLQRVLRTV